MFIKYYLKNKYIKGIDNPKINMLSKQVKL